MSAGHRNRPNGCPFQRMLQDVPAGRYTYVTEKILQWCLQRKLYFHEVTLHYFLFIFNVYICNLFRALSGWLVFVRMEHNFLHELQYICFNDEAFIVILLIWNTWNIFVFCSIPGVGGQHCQCGFLDNYRLVRVCLCVLVAVSEPQTGH